ncbi:double-stranded RNA-binding protein 1-like isoform X1 [Solanum tuberosum]|uniref:double-stranded RNA-binding protein 1-like isoform X1 n=2 Tax=Solanum tuberosum TaxID=4113 RepID=UPI0003D24CC7|nr:PREDICTED: double-stranded RNA-binding protein 1-like isoform X1 [Solanum tuberosum]
MYKTKLQELCHQFEWNLPEYATEKDGPDHNPRFTATVIVNGVSFESPKDQCRSSKEAQNHAAHIAYDHFILPQPILFSPHNLPSPALIPTSLGASTSKSKVGDRPPNMDVFQQRQNNIGQLSHVNGTALAIVDTNTSKGMLHLYKSRLQHYAQKQNLTLPVYSSELDGPPHARCFRSKVTVDGVTYETQEFFSTLKEAEHAAAKVAFESLALNDTQEDEGLYKTLLQELAQKEALLFPVYDTARTGPPHAPVFRSMVEVGDGTFQGQEAKTKKQAEMNAAKVAYNALVKRGQLDEPLHVLSVSSECVVADVSQLVVQQKTKLIIEELSLQNEEADTNAKRHRCSNAPNTYSLIRDHRPAAPFVASDSTDAVVESVDSGTYAGTSILPSEKIFILPRKANMDLPSGASVLPCSNEKWVAASLELNRNH